MTRDQLFRWTSWVTVSHVSITEHRQWSSLLGIFGTEKILSLHTANEPTRNPASAMAMSGSRLRP